MIDFPPSIHRLGCTPGILGLLLLLFLLVIFIGVGYLLLMKSILS